MRVGVIVLSWNSKAFIDDCLKGLLEFEKSPIYVVDNGSEDGSAEYLEKAFPTINLIKSPMNLGFSSGNNLGIKHALRDGCEAILLLNNDTVIDEPFLAPCIKALKDDSSIGIVGPVIVEANEPEVIQCLGGRITLGNLGFPYVGMGEKYRREDRIQEVGYVLGAAMLIRGDLVESLGGLDPEYYPAYVEEADMCYRAKKMGYRSVVCFSSRVRHIGDKSSGNAANSFRRYMANRFLFGLKHLGAMQFLVAGGGLVLKVVLRKIFPHKKRVCV